MTDDAEWPQRAASASRSNASSSSSSSVMRPPQGGHMPQPQPTRQAPMQSYKPTNPLSQKWRESHIIDLTDNTESALTATSSSRHHIIPGSSIKRPHHVDHVLQLQPTIHDHMPQLQPTIQVPMHSYRSDMYVTDVHTDHYRQLHPLHVDDIQQEMHFICDNKPTNPSSQELRKCDPHRINYLLTHRINKLTDNAELALTAASSSSSPSRAASVSSIKRSPRPGGHVARPPQPTRQAPTKSSRPDMCATDVRREHRGWSQREPQSIQVRHPLCSPYAPSNVRATGVERRPGSNDDR